MTLREIGLMPVEEYNGWWEYSQIEPWGSHYNGLRDDFRAGQICATVANWAGKQLAEGADPTAADDFMPSLRNGDSEAKPKVSSLLLDDPEEQSALIKSALFGRN